MPKIKHVVFFRFKDGTSASHIQEMFCEIGRLQKLIPGMLDFTWGPNVSSEGLNQGFTHALTMTFESAAARDAYLPHPEHERVKDLVLPHVASVIVLDYEA